VLNKTTIRIGFYTYAISLAAGSLLNINQAHQTNILIQDKLIHYLAYLILCLILFLYLKTHHKKNILSTCVSFSLIFGIILELLQPAMTTTRVFDPYDLIANALGVFTSALIISRNKKSIVKKLETFM